VKTEPNVQLSLFGCLFLIPSATAPRSALRHSLLHLRRARHPSACSPPCAHSSTPTCLLVPCSLPSRSQPHAARMFSSLPRRRLLTVPHPQRLVCRCCRRTFSLPQVPAPSSPQPLTTCPSQCFTPLPSTPAPRPPRPPSRIHPHVPPPCAHSSTPTCLLVPCSLPSRSQPHVARMFSSLLCRRLLTVPRPQRLVDFIFQI
jgi:hypothetical protein